MSKSIQGQNIESLNDAQRGKLLEIHPIVEREYMIPTPMQDAAYAIARDRVWSRRPGIVFYGPPRIGKTRCAEEIQRLLQTEFPGAYVTIVYARRATRASDGHMFRLILEAQRHALSVRRSPDDLFNNAITDIEMAVSKTKGRQFVLIIDECQLLNDTDLQQLVVFHNALAAKRIKMTAISFAQPEILHRRTSLMATKQTQIISRFLSESIQFVGCSGVRELKHLLEAYDELSDFPEGSGWSYTQFFFPMAYANGFRLKHHASEIWMALDTALGATTGGTVPMEHLCLTIEYLLLRGRANDSPAYVLSDDEIAEAVESANLEGFFQLMDAGPVEG